MNINLDNYVCKGCRETTLSFTVVADKDEAYTSNLDLFCTNDNCTKTYANNIVSSARANNTSKHKERIVEKYNLEEN